MNVAIERITTDVDQVVKTVLERLAANDDARLWEVALTTILSDAQVVLAQLSVKQHAVLQVGCCSHWIAPSKLRWVTKNGQFAGPAGYQSRGGWFGGLPEFDWSACFATLPAMRRWVPVEGRVKQRFPLIRVAIPARTASRIRASVHVLWERGPRPDFTLARLYYGFRRSAIGWRCRAYLGPQFPRSIAKTASPGPGLVNGTYFGFYGPRRMGC